MQRCEDTLSTLKAMQEQTPTPTLERDISLIGKEIEFCIHRRSFVIKLIFIELSYVTVWCFQLGSLDLGIVTNPSS